MATTSGNIDRLFFSLLADVIEAAGYRPRGIVHVGAHKGQEVERYLALGPSLIVWLEAEERWMARLGKLARSSPPTTRQIALRALIADRDGAPIEFHRYSNKGLSSSLFRPAELMKDAWPGVAPTGEVVEMTTARLDTTLRGAGISPADVDVLAIDIQGAELAALKGAGAYLDAAEFVEVELSQVEVYQGAPLGAEVETFLQAAGFRRLTEPRWHGDVVFRRDHQSIGAPPRRPVRAVVAATGKHLFEHVRDPRVSVTAADTPADGDVDLVVVPCGSSDTVVINETELPDAVWQAARAGRGAVILDASTEGSPHSRERTADLHGFLARKGASPRHAVYLTQDRDYRRDYLDFCARSGIGETMSVVLNDYFIWTVTSQLEDSGAGLFAERLQRFRGRASHRSRRFMSLNYTPRPIKVLFLLQLMRDGLWDQGYISFGGFDKNRKTDHGGYKNLKRLIHAAHGFEDLAAELEGWLVQLEAYGEVYFSRPWTKRARSFSGLWVRDQDFPEFDDCWFSVVTETEMRPRASRITEKSLKPLSNFHPFVTFGNLGALRLVRELGFETFGELIDESYDEEPDPRRRFELAYAEVRRLCALDETDLARRICGVADKLEHNARHALVEMPGALRRRRDAELLDEILGAVRAETSETVTA